MVIGDIDVVGTAPWGSDASTIRVQLESFGSLEIDKGIISFVHNGDEVIKLVGSADLLESSSFIEYAFDPLSRNLFLVSWAGNNIYLSDAQSRDLRVIGQLDRNADDDAGLYRLSLVNYHDVLLIIYESGIFCFERGGELRWKQHILRDWFFSEVNEEGVWYESEFDGKWRYSLEDDKKKKK